MMFTIAQGLRTAELQAEMYRLQKLLARRDVQQAPLIQATAGGAMPPAPAWGAPVPTGVLPTRRENYRPFRSRGLPASDFLSGLQVQLQSLGTKAAQDTKGGLLEACATNRDLWLRAHYNRLRRIGILTGGGDAPGMNAALRAATLTALNFAFAARWNPRVYGIRDSYQGLYNWILNPRPARGQPRFGIPLTRDVVWDIASNAGSMLRSLRFPAWQQDAQGLTAAQVKKILDGLVVIGGDGSTRGAKALWQAARVPVVVCPGTIDNDTHPWSDRSIGFDSAASMATALLNALRATAEASGRVFLVQLMGRRCGDLPLFAGVSGHANLVLTAERSEEEWNNLRLLRLLKLAYTEIDKNPYNSAIIAVAEGVTLPDDVELERGRPSMVGSPLLGRLEKAFEDLNDDGFLARFHPAHARRRAYRQEVVSLWKSFKARVWDEWAHEDPSPCPEVR
jgi:6-phosphofructokinase